LAELPINPPRRVVRCGLPEPPQQLLTNVASYEQGDERANCGPVKPGGNLLQALIDVLRIEVLVKLLVHEVRDVMQVWVDAGSCCAGADR